MIEIKVNTYGTDGFQKTNEQTKLLNSEVNGAVAVAISYYADGSVEVRLDDEQNGLEFGSTFMQFDNLDSYYEDGMFNLAVKDVSGIKNVAYSEFKKNITNIMQACDELKVELEKIVK